MTQTPEEKSAAAERARLWLYFRLTPEQVLAIEAWQRDHGLSMLMGHSTTSTGTDHCHATGLIRGRLDFRLNKALGMIEAFTNKLEAEDMLALGATTKDEASSIVLGMLSTYMACIPAVKAVGPVYGLINKAKRKAVMIYGSPEGPLPPVKKAKRAKK